MYSYIPLTSGDACWQNLKPPVESIDCPDVESAIIILDSVDGLFLCCYGSPGACGRAYFVCNHRTKKFTLLPDPGLSQLVHNGDIEDECLSDSMTLAYDLSKSPHYKVIMIRSLQIGEFPNWYYHTTVRMYSSETKCWTPWGLIVGTKFFIEMYAGVFLNNAVYWPSDDSEISSLYYDVDGESLHSFPMPPFPNGTRHRKINHFGKAKGCLFMIIPITRQSSKYDIHVLARDCSSWSIEHRVDLDVIARTIGMEKLCLMCAVGEEDGEESLLILLYAAEESYKPKEESFKKVCDLDDARSEAWSGRQSDSEWSRVFRKVHYQFVENPFALP